MESDEIQEKIPHRPPFLWVDRIVDEGPDWIETEKYISPDLELFKGHYPDYPIMPGVILCEAVFQTGALLISNILKEENSGKKGIPVLTRIFSAKFKREIQPGKTIRLVARLKEKVGPAWMLKGKVLINGKVAVVTEFGCTLVERS